MLDRAIAQSGCGFPLPTQESQQRNGATWATSLGCPDVACLRAKPADQLLTASLSPTARRVPNVDGKVLPLQVPDALKRGRFHRVPFLQGTIADEGRLTVATTYDLAGRRLTAEGYPPTPSSPARSPGPRAWRPGTFGPTSTSSPTGTPWTI
ncbi:carboxylesterase family protein [Actinocorallia sp. B10E7]|uniref:carboxylesterase family protein n=1 Tax=Actinocorallia sp. B10E7 TaxID=3153558 RepID=UPI00325D141A